MKACWVNVFKVNFREQAIVIRIWWIKENYTTQVLGLKSKAIYYTRIKTNVNNKIMGKNERTREMWIGSMCQIKCEEIRNTTV